MKSKLPAFLSLAIALSTVTPFVTHAQLSVGVLVDTRGQQGYGDRDRNASSSAREISTTDRMRINATSSNEGNENSNSDENASASDSVKGHLTAQNHRSAMAAFVQSLLAVADREGGLGEQIREIAHAQNDAIATTTNAIQRVSSRGFLMSLFFGSDYKNLGVLRHGIVRTQNHLDGLNAVLANTTDPIAHSVLIEQIRVLENDKANMESFMAAHKESFSFFGWCAKLFVKADIED